MVRTLALIAFLAAPLHAQGPAADWRTIETQHFRVHYPREYEAWALRAASRLESIREAVSKEVGFTPRQTVDVLIGNPIALPNGAAFPLLDSPRMIFFAEPPGPDEQLGAYGHWIDLLAVHEYAHTAHMLRPSRNPLSRLLEKSVLPLNPIALRAPRWVTEGYATVIEGRLTGAGRPTSTFRALLLRRWAEAGRLPSYGELNASRRFAGPSMAYLMGSAFLEWLEERAGPDSLRNLWLRLTARHRRSFDEAFTGVFGERADRLYGRFVAEVTAAALELEKTQELREGDLFQETPRASGEPAVSPDGKRIAVVIRDRDEPEKLVIWSTAEPVAEQKKYDERLQKILERDPEDVAPLRTKPLPRKELHSLVMPDGGDIRGPRWTRDGKAIVFSHRVPDAEGFLHWDLYRWDFERLARITHLADVRDADPLPDGRTAIAVRSRGGMSQLVNVDLASGAVTPRTEASIDVVYTHPRVSANGRIAYVAHRGGTWRLFVDDQAKEIHGDVSSPEWVSEDEVVVTVAKGGFAELHRVPGGAITSTRGGAFDAAPSPDGRIFFMSLEPDGYVVRVISEWRTGTLACPDRQECLSSTGRPPVIPAPPPAVTPFAAETLAPSRAYGLGRQELSWFMSQNIAPDQRAFELGARLGDVVGRLDTLLIASIARRDSPQGVALASAWRGWPVAVRAHAFHVEDRHSCLSPEDRQECLSSTGVELRASWSHRWPLHRLTVDAGALTDDFAFGSAAFSTRQMRGDWRIEESLRLDVDDAHSRIAIGAAIRRGSFRIAANYQRDHGDDLSLGGLPSSILPRSAYARRILDPALPLATMSGSGYDGWRIETRVPSMPFTAFYQRHELGGARLSLAGIEADLSADPFPILKTPGLDFTLGVARVFDAPLQDETKWWLGMRWRP